MRHHSVIVIAAAIVGTMSLSGCAATRPEPAPPPSPSQAPEPSESPTPAPTEDPESLTIEPGGLGDLRIGEPVSADTTLVTWDPDFCVFEDDGSAPDPSFGRWVATQTFVGADAETSRPAFGVSATEGGPVGFIQTTSPAIPTPEGVHVGSSRAEVEAAYPDAVHPQSVGDISDIYSIAEGSGQLVIEVASSSADYWRADQIDTAVIISVIGRGETPFATAATDHVAGGCL